MGGLCSPDFPFEEPTTNAHTSHIVSWSLIQYQETTSPSTPPIPGLRAACVYVSVQGFGEKVGVYWYLFSNHCTRSAMTKE